MLHDWEQMASVWKKTKKQPILMPSFLNLVTVWLWACKHSVHTLRAAASFTLTLICITLATLLPLNRSARSSHIYLPFICSWAANRWLPNRFCARMHVCTLCLRVFASSVALCDQLIFPRQRVCSPSAGSVWYQNTAVRERKALCVPSVHASVRLFF